MKFFKQYYFSEDDQRQAHHTLPSITTVRPAVNLIQDSFVRSIKNALKENETDKTIGVLMSGGVDSSLLLAMLRSLTDKEIICFTAMTDSADPDVLPSKEVTRAFGVKWIKCRLNIACLADRLNYILPISDGGLYATAASLAEDICMEYCHNEGITNLWAGNGLDMFFGGGVDPNHFKASDEYEFHKLFWTYSFDLLKNRFYLQNGIGKDLLAEKRRIKIIMPFENKDTIISARTIRADVLFKYGEDKYPVRLLAHRYGVPLHEARREKDALQHSSGIFGLLRQYMYETLPTLTHDSVNFKLRKEYFQNNPNTDLQLFLTLINDRLTSS